MKVGDYVRFKDKRENTYIRKIVEIPEDNRYASIYIDKEANYSNGLSPKNIIKSSPNIIDLIEVGDYANGYKVIGITEEYIDLQKGLDTQKVLLVLNGKVYEEAIKIREKDIKSIVTKEQFEAIKYEIK